MAQDGRREEASAHLAQIADGNGLGRESDLLAALAEGFAHRGETALAAVAGAFAWTRARGRGGWLAFGGETHLDALRTATGADAGTAMAVVGDEIARAIRSDRGGTWGIAQALVLAFVAGVATLDHAEAAVDTAFACFDAALEVIDARTPRVHPHDDPDLPYRPPSPDHGETAPGNVDAALAAAAIAGLARPERAAKRRAMLATEHLLTQRPAAAADGIRHALANLSDPATLTWLLSLLVRSAGPGSEALASSGDSLAALAAGPHLVVRTLARSLTDPEPALGPPEPADPELIGAGPTGLWTPQPDDHDDDGAAQQLVNEVAGERLATAEPLLPGLKAAVIRRTASGLGDKTLNRRMRGQLDALEDRHGDERRRPDAWLAIAEATEDALQRAAAGARTADLRRGAPRDPAAREAELAARLVDQPELALALEATRLPRPALPPPPSRYDSLWDRISSPAATQPSAGAPDRLADRVSGTVAAPVITAFSQLDDAGGGWRVLASVEALRSSAAYGVKQRDVLAFRFRGPEAREEHEQAGLALPPFAEGHLDQWTWLLTAPAPAPTRFRTVEPLTGLDTSVGAGTDGRSGLGLPKRAVVPGPTLVVALRATAISGPFQLRDDEGPLAALRTWRTLDRPRLSGHGSRPTCRETRDGFDTTSLHR